MLSGVRVLVALAFALSLASCDFQPDPPPGPSALPSDRLVDVKVLYRQPNACVNTETPCDNLVVFFGSWMHPGDEIFLDQVPGTHDWTGIAHGVPVNWPPVDSPHLVRVFDPHLLDTPTGGVTGARLTIGGQLITEYDSPGTPKESGLIYIDDNGVGHNPP